MSKLQLIIFLPTVILFIATLFKKYCGFVNKIFPLLPLWFLFLLFTSNYNSLEILHFGQGGLGLDFQFNEANKSFLILLGILWVLLSFYLPKYFILSSDKNEKCFQFNILCGAIFVLLTLIILAKNLITILLFYQLLAVIVYFFINYFITKPGQRAAHNFGFFALLAPIFLFLATTLIYKISGTVQFTAGGVFSEGDLNLLKYIIILCLCLLALCAVAFAPLYLLYSNLYYLNPPALAVVFLFGFGLSNLLILNKIINYIFGTKLFFLYIDKINNYNLLTVILGFNLLVSAALAIWAKNLKQMLTFLFFNQFIWVVFVFIVLGFSTKQMNIALFSFALSFIVIFLSIGNISLYLQSSQEKKLNGIFYKLRITVILLIFALLNIIGLVPAIGSLEKYFALKHIIGGHNVVAGIILAINSVLLLVLSIKIIYPMFEIAVRNTDPKTYEIAKNIEYDLNLILPILLTGLTMVTLCFFSNLLSF